MWIVSNSLITEAPIAVTEKCQKRTKRIIKDFLTHMAPSFANIRYFFSSFYSMKIHVLLFALSLSLSLCVICTEEGAYLWLTFLCVCLCMWVFFFCFFVNVFDDEKLRNMKHHMNREHFFSSTLLLKIMYFVDVFFFCYFCDYYHTNSNRNNACRLPEMPKKSVCVAYLWNFWWESVCLCSIETNGWISHQFGWTLVKISSYTFTWIEINCPWNYGVLCTNVNSKTPLNILNTHTHTRRNPLFDCVCPVRQFVRVLSFQLNAFNPKYFWGQNATTKKYEERKRKAK